MNAIAPITPTAPQVEAPSAYRITAVMSEAMQTIARLQEVDGEIITDDAELLAALTAENVNVDTILRRLVQATLDAKANEAAAAERAANLAARKARFKRQQEVYRQTVVDIMQALGLDKMKDPEFSLSVAAGKQKPIVVDEAGIPAHYFDEVVTTTKTLAMDRVKADLAADIAVAGVTLSNGSPVLTIRAR